MSTPTTVAQARFHSWFVDVLDELYKQHDAGLAIVMIAFPLLERYLRRKVGLTPEQKLTDKDCAFFVELRSIVPGRQDNGEAKRFWDVYRNALLHQATFSS